MTDAKIPDITTQLTTRALLDLLVVEHDPSGTSETVKMTAKDFLREVATELTISSDAVTLTQLNHKLQPQSGTSDNLSTINGTTAGQSGVLYASDYGTDTITIKHNVGNILCMGAADITLSHGCVFWYSDGTKVYISGGGGGGGGGGTTMTTSSISPTASNVTAAVNTRYIADVSGLTANRNFVLPAGTAGDEIEICIGTGDNQYALVLIGDTGITITGNGVKTASATEWSRLFITGETVRFVATSATNWHVVQDGRVMQIGVMERQTAQSINSATDTKIQTATIISNVGDVCDNTTNYRVTCRRAGLYSIKGYIALAGGLDDQEGSLAEIFINGVVNRYVQTFVSTSSSDRQGTAEIVYEKNLSVGDYVELYVFHNEGAAVNTNTTTYPQLSVIEQF